jgi:hypothetical protein
MHRGYIKAWRAMADHQLWRNGTPEQKCIIFALLWLASHKENSWVWKGEKFTVKPGQMITSLESIREKSGKGISIRNVRTTISILEKYDFLTNETTKQGRLITITNWILYQTGDNHNDKANDNQVTNDRQTTDNQVTTIKNVRIKECKNVEEEEKIKHTHSPEANGCVSDIVEPEKFDLFWKNYPRKVKPNKQGTIRNWNGLINRQETDPDQLILCSEKYSMIVKGKEDKHVLHPATFLGRDRRWKDFLDSPSSAPTAPALTPEQIADQERTRAVIKAQYEREGYGK